MYGSLRKGSQATKRQDRVCVVTLSFRVYSFVVRVAKRGMKSVRGYLRRAGGLAGHNRGFLRRISREPVPRDRQGPDARNPCRVSGTLDYVKRAFCVSATALGCRSFGGTGHTFSTLSVDQDGEARAAGQVGVQFTQTLGDRSVVSSTDCTSVHLDHGCQFAHRARAEQLIGTV